LPAPVESQERGPAPRRQHFRRAAVAAALGFSAFMALLLVVDLGYIGEFLLNASPDRYRRFRENIFVAETLHEVILSLGSATVTTALALLVAVPAGYALSRFRIRGKLLVDTLVDSAIVLPPLIMGLSLLVLLSVLRRAGEALGTPPDPAAGVPGRPNPVLNSFYEFFVYAKPGIVLAQFSVATALAVRSMKAAFDAADRRVEDVALTLGCTRFGAFWRAALPQARSGLLTGAVVAWSYTVGLFAPVAILAGTVKGRTAVLPTRAYMEVSNGYLEEALALTLVMAVIAMTVLIALKLLARRNAAGAEVSL